ncbi:PREDICTED: mediator of DNA damage checkpoint protein 1 [Chrysochloris asiatica]|uniref:Mediator of DNA damage checkpoint protein 1 n=1 Tax=Chrysochloris asiatica TaxID=185453 RepID=A0A9B0U8Z9_CHRAS|nr:PREDICTED: mediator of DNA damage checkpoint protein 1 [Chrysochloris asiatica]
MEDTQIIDWDIEEEEETERVNEFVGYNLEPLGQLRVFSGTHGPEKDFPLYLGENVVGRMPNCSVTLPFPSISKQHAVIEVLAWNKAPILRDCGSLNGTQTLRPPKVLSPGMTHRLRDQELILFADLPCQYHRLDVSLPLASRGPLTIEETPRVQGGTRAQGLLLAEDSEEEVDCLSERCVVKASRIMSTPRATVVPESDEEGASSAPDGPGVSFAFNLDSDTDDEGQQPASRKASSSASRRGAPAKAKRPGTDGVAIELRLKKDQPSAKRRDSDTKVERGPNKVVGPIRVIPQRSHPVREDSDTDVDERGQPSTFMDSDTDMEEEEIPATPAIVPMKKNQILHRVGRQGPGMPALACLQKSRAGADAVVEQGEAPLAVHVERNPLFMVLNSDTDDEEEVSAALTLACLKESRTRRNHRVIDVEEGSDTDAEEERHPVGKSQTIPKVDTDKERTLVTTCSGKSQPPQRAGYTDAKEEKGSSGASLGRRQASTTVDSNTETEEEIPLQPAVTHLEKHQVPVEINQTVMEAEGSLTKLPVGHQEKAQDCETDEEESLAFRASALAVVRKSQLPAEGNPRVEWATAVLKWERALEAGAQGGSPVVQVEQDLLPVSRKNLTDLVVDIGTPGTQRHRERVQTPTERQQAPHVDRTKDSKDRNDDSEDLDLQATQCFVEKENTSLEATKSMEEVSTQAFPFTPPREEPGPSRCSFQTPGTLDEPWEVLATQPFCPRESEASETQHIAAHLEAHGTCPSPPRATLQNQHPESPIHTESSGMQAEEKGLEREIPGRVTPEKEPLERETKELPTAAEREDGIGEEELTRGLQNREQKPVLAREPQSLESDTKLKSVNTERDMKSLEVELETSKEIQKKEIEKQALVREICDGETEGPAPERASELAGLEVKVSKEMFEDAGTQKRENKGGSQDQEEQTSLSTPEPRMGAGALQGLDSAPVASGSQAGRGRVTPMNPRRQQRGGLNCKMPSTGKASRVRPAFITSQGDQESPDALLPPSMREASTTLQKPLIAQNQKHPAPRPLLSPSLPSLEVPIPRTRQKGGSSRALEAPSSSALEPHYTQSKVRPRRVSLVTPSSVSSIALESYPPNSTDQTVTPNPTSHVTQGRTRRTSVRTPEPVEPMTPELQPSTLTDPPVVTPKPTSRATRGRTHRSSVRTTESVEPTATELQPSTSIDQAVTPKPTSRATRGRTHRSSVKTPEPVEPTASEIQPSTSTDQPVTPEATSQATRGRIRRSAVRTQEPIEPIAPELQSSTSTDQPAPCKPTRDKTHRSSIKTPESVTPTAPELQPSTSTDQFVIPKPTSQATQGRTRRSSVKTPEPVKPTAPDNAPPITTDQHVTPEPIAQCDHRKTVKSSTVNAVQTPTTLEFQCPAPTDQLIPSEPISQARCNRRQRTTRKQESLTAPIIHEPCSTLPERKSQSSRSQRQGAVRAAESLKAVPEPSCSQLLEAPSQAPQIQTLEAASRSGFTPEPQPKPSQSRKRTSTTKDSPPPKKQPQREEVPQKIEFLKEEQEDTAEKPGKKENVVIPGPGKRKRDQTEEPKETQSRNLRRSKPNQELTVPKVLFTGIVDARGERAVLALGGSLANSVTEASHLVTDRIRRTVKFLCALGRGIPIVSLDWLHQSRRAGCFLPPDEYVVTDPEHEKNFGFSLRESLSRAQKRKLLEGYEIHVTPGVQPPPPQMGEIINCCGGTVLPNMPRSYKPQRVVITCSQDFPRCSIPCRIGLPLLSPEFLLTGVLKQEASPEAFILSTSEMSST